MAMPPAGWYEDPGVPGQIRYWDGSIWTGHTAPADGVGEPQTSTETGDGAGADGRGPSAGEADARDAARDGSAQAGSGQDMSAQGTYTQGGYSQGGYSQGGYSPDGGTPAGYGQGGYGYGGATQPGDQGSYNSYNSYSPAGTEKKESGGLGTGVIFALIGAAALLIVAVVVVMFVVLGNDDGSDEADGDSDSDSENNDDEENSEGEDEQNGGGSEEGGETGGGDVSTGNAADFDLSGGDEESLTLVVDEAGIFHIETETPSGDDPILTINDSGGSEVSRVDDGGSSSSNSFDAGITTYLEEGEYEVVVSTYQTRDAAGEVSVESAPADETRMSPGDYDYSISDGGFWVGTIDVEAGERLTVDVRGDSRTDDAELAVYMPGGSVLENDDRNTTAPSTGNSVDPYVEATSSSAGTAVVVITGYNDRATDGTVTIESEN